MCMLFYNINDAAKPEEFSLVLVNNRDEFWQRPTKAADFWIDNNSCISGLDNEPGRVGGTWFGMNKSGRVGCLLNIASQQDKTKQGRGFMVSDFLKTPDSIDSYAQKLAAQKDHYNGFILHLIELRKNGSRVIQVTNDKLADSPVTEFKPDYKDIFAAGNSSMNKPWGKIMKGKEMFGDIVRSHKRVLLKTEMQEKLFELMADKSKHLPDQQLQEDGEKCHWTKESMEIKSSLCVWDPDHHYGTRTTTVLLIDGQGNCDYSEKTLVTPVNIEDPQWSINHFHFPLHLSDF